MVRFRRPAAGLAFFTFFLLSASGASAQLLHQVAVGACQSTDDSKEFEFAGSSFIIPTGMTGGADFSCGLDAALATPDSIEAVVVFLGDHSQSEDATVEVCFTDLDSTPTEVCGAPALSSGWGYSLQTVKAAPPPGYPITKTTTAFVRIHVPAPNPRGYSFLRGYIVY